MKNALPLFGPLAMATWKPPRFLLDAGAAMDYIFRTPGEDQTALGAACLEGHLEVALLLVQAGADLSLGYDGGAPLCVLVVGMACPFLLSQHMGVTTCLPVCTSGLAAEFGYLELANLLLQAGADKDLCDDVGLTSLVWAAANDRMEIANLLLDSGANRYLGNHLGVTPLVCASCKGNVDMVRLLLEPAPGTDLDGLDGLDGHSGALGTALLAASNKGHTQTVRLLLEVQPDNSLEFVVPAAIFCAAWHGYTNAMQLLLDFLAERGSACDCGWAMALVGGADMSSLRSHSTHPQSCDMELSVVEASIQGDLGVLSLLTSLAPGHRHVSLAALICAARSGHVELVRNLLQALTDHELLEAVSPTAVAFICAAHQRQHELVESLYRDIALERNGPADADIHNLWHLLAAN